MLPSKVYQTNGDPLPPALECKERRKEDYAPEEKIHQTQKPLLMLSSPLGEMS
jgi:hypothetical protein